MEEPISDSKSKLDQIDASAEATELDLADQGL